MVRQKNGNTATIVSYCCLLIKIYLDFVAFRPDDVVVVVVFVFFESDAFLKWYQNLRKDSDFKYSKQIERYELFWRKSCVKRGVRGLRRRLWRTLRASSCFATTDDVTTHNSSSGGAQHDVRICYRFCRACSMVLRMVSARSGLYEDDSRAILTISSE